MSEGILKDSTGKPFTVNNTDAWAAERARNSDGYGSATLTYAERWMALMEAEAAKGDVATMLVKHADKLSYTADTEGISGWMHGAAARGIAAYWKHGEDFRRWFNRDVQIGNEGDAANKSGRILNPAVLTVGRPSES